MPIKIEFTEKVIIVGLFMVHVFCLNDVCRRVIHLGGRKIWNFNGIIRCRSCGYKMSVDVKNGKIRNVKSINIVQDLLYKV